MRVDNEDIEIFAKTIYGEADPNNILDAQAIASVIMNRVKLRNWPNDISAVCLQPWQFSCWNPGDAGRQRMADADKNNNWYKTCVNIARRAAEKVLPDPTNRSTHYYATYIPKPKWAKRGKKVPAYRVEHKSGYAHLFYNDIDTPPPGSAKEALDQIRPLRTTKTVKAASVAVAGTTTLGGVVELCQQINPVLPIAQQLMDYAPWAMVVILSIALGLVVYNRVQARKRGLR